MQKLQFPFTWNYVHFQDAAILLFPTPGCGQPALCMPAEGGFRQCHLHHCCDWTNTSDFPHLFTKIKTWLSANSFPKLFFCNKCPQQLQTLSWLIVLKKRTKWTFLFFFSPKPNLFAHHQGSSPCPLPTPLTSIFSFLDLCPHVFSESSPARSLVSPGKNSTCLSG